MALEGSLEVFNLPEILQMVALQKKTGILTVQGEADIVAVSFLGGRVVAADALNQTVEEGLGQVLSQMQLVKPEDFAAVAAEHQAGGGRMVDLLQERGYVERPHLLRALRTQTYGLLMQLLDWKRGDFKFYGGDEVSYEDGFDPITVQEILSRGVASEARKPTKTAAPAPSGPPSTPGPGATFARVSPPPQRLRLLDEAPDGRPREGSGIWISREEKMVLDRLDGRRTVEEIGRETRLGTQRTLTALERLAGMGLATAASAPRSGAAAPAAALTREPVLAPPLPPRPVAVPPPMPPAPTFGVPPPKAAPPAPKLVPVKAPTEALRLEQLRFEPEPALAPEPQREISKVGSAPRPRPAARSPVAQAPASPGLALATGLLILILVVSGARPGLLVLPYPWQEAARTNLEKAQRSALYFKIDRACRTFFLLEGRYPDDLGRLTGMRLLGRDDLHDPRGRPLAYATQELSYTIHPIEGGEPIADLGRSEAVTGDFLLDAEFTKLPARSEIQALVLLD